jgi:hypothetical protein
MRQKLNENPLVQAAAIGVLALLVGVMLLMRSGGGGAAEPPATGDTGTLSDPAAAATVDPAAPATADPASATAAPSAVSTTTGAFKAGPGLPAEIVNAYDSGRAVALLIVSRRGIDDRDLEQTVDSVGSRADVAVFETDVKDVADYARITQGADLNRTPALIVIRPKRFAEGSTPTVTIAYGFRGEASVQQAFEDALYAGPDDLPYHP